MNEATKYRIIEGVAGTGRVFFEVQISMNGMWLETARVSCIEKAKETLDNLKRIQASGQVVYEVSF